MCRYRLMRVQGASMSPTLHDGDLVLVDTQAYRVTTPQVGELIAARPAALAGKAVVKRVTAVSEAGWMLRGDNPSESLDSRGFGPVTREQLLGAVCCRLWPLKRPAVSC
jgi:nickel-type superoxide dismutase maturation protease